MSWQLRIGLFLFGTMIGTQNPLHMNPFDYNQLLMESKVKEQRELIAQAEQFRLQDELKHDKETHQYSVEMANLWVALANTQNAYYDSKWNKNIIDHNLEAQITLLKEEILKRQDPKRLK